MPAGAGVVAAWLLARAARRRREPEPLNRWQMVTINYPPQRLSEPGELPEPIARFGEALEIMIRPAPGGRGTELGARLRESPARGRIAKAAGRTAEGDARQVVQSALRAAKSLIETGEVLQPPAPPTTRRRTAARLSELATLRAGGEGGR
ncbi:hypothetical protein NDW01_12610 [Actinoallomurus sp. WRP6H-15]|nr:hypothetical protein [Actinoallomurus soli]